MSQDRRSSLEGEAEQLRPQRQSDESNAGYPVLRRVLEQYHIFAIGLSGVIGAGVFIDAGTSLQVSGPIATITAYFFVALVSICVMECIAEMIYIWPVSNPFVVFVQHFVDEDLGYFVGFAYWYTYGMGLETLIIAIANLVDFWGMSPTVKALVVFVACPVMLLSINLFGVKTFANIELVAATLKLVFVIVAFVLMICVNAGALGDMPRIGSTYINESWTFNADVVGNSLSALSASIYIAAFAFIGVEATAITAFEARNPDALRRPVKYIAWITGPLYIVSVSAQVSNVRWCDPELPKLWDQKVESGRGSPSAGNPNPRPTISITVLALADAGSYKAASIINAFLIFAIISAANTALYVASRSLFGQTRRIQVDPQGSPGTGSLRARAISLLARFGTVHPASEVPAVALVTSWVVFAWIPFIDLKQNRTLIDVQEILSTLGSVACVIVWGSQCLAFLCYYYWLRNVRDDLRATPDLAQLDRWENRGQRHTKTWLGFLQPLPAMFGLASSLVIALVLTTAPWWNGQVSVKRVISVYLFPGLLIVLYVLRKIFKRQHGGIGHSFDWPTLRPRLQNLNYLAEEKKTPRTQGQNISMETLAEGRDR